MTVSPAIRTILQRSIGLAPESLGDRVIQTAVERRAADLRLTSPTDYEFRLATDPSEVQALADAVVVHETWFYRYPASFTLTAQVVAGRVRAGERVRILSVPCSTGEEPYSIAMTLLDAHIPPPAFEVLGVDVSVAAVAQAEAGVYRDLSFREREAPVNPAHFTAVAGGRAVAAGVKRAVTFRQGNLADPFFLADSPEFAVIFCRNLFIYLTAETRLRAVGTLTRLLAPGGVLFLGHADTAVLAGTDFRSYGPATAFAFCRQAEAPLRTPDLPPPPPPPLPPPLATQKAGRAALLDRPTRPPTEPPAVPPGPTPASEPVVPATLLPAGQPADPLTAARVAADAGDWAAAAAACEHLVATHSAGADTFVLLGAARSAAGDSAGAAREFEKALYLNPKHYDALLSLLALAERRGDAAAAANYRRRARAAEVPS